MIEEKIVELGYTLPVVAKPLAAYVPAVKVGDYIFTSGQVPLVDGKIVYTGKVGGEVSEEDGIKAAEICALNCLAAVKSMLNSLDEVEKVVKVTVFVNSVNDFVNQPEVANGASELIGKIFGEAGKHARSAVGVNVLPRNASVEIEMIVKVK
ncbi:MAG TPA: RidA family protein [Ignavibacteriaceae bacterium]|jgi:enamine deaminase RidA (YjgF/YER057c/UK114 family)|nr:RidA family protein [Ignavibacteriaceae bacterium]